MNHSSAKVNTTSEIKTSLYVSIMFMVKACQHYCSAKVWKQQTTPVFFATTNRNTSWCLKSGEKWNAVYLFIFCLSLVVFTLDWFLNSLNSIYFNLLMSNNKSCCTLNYIVCICPANSLILHFSAKLHSYHYGNTGCGVFKWGVQN